MSDDWIKLRCNLWQHPKVVRIMSAICPQNIGQMSAKCQIIGALARTWAIADAHTEDGHLEGYVSAALDAEIGITGWTAALESVGWIVVGAQGLTVPRFEEHNGESAKKRAEDAKRKRQARKSAKCPTNAGQVSANSRTKNGLEKEEEKEKEVNTYTHTAAAVPSQDQQQGPGQPHWSTQLLVPFDWSATRTIELLTRWDNFQQARQNPPLVDIQANEILRKAVSRGWDLAKFEEAIGDSIRGGWKTIHLESDMRARQTEKPKRKKFDINDIDLSQPM